jgi:hypothetical protein
MPEVPWQDLERDVRQLRIESSVVYTTLVKPNFGTGGHHFFMTLYGYVMAAFAMIDLHSQLWGRRTKRAIQQTPRMTAYMDQFFPGTSAAHVVAVQLWRHTLMHTARPRKLTDRASGMEFHYLLHWSSEQLPKEQYFELESGEKLNLSVNLLLADIADANHKVRHSTDRDGPARDRANVAWQDIVIQRFDVAAV